MSTTPLPLFPLSSLLLPHGRMPLQIFERRYLDLVRDCLRHERGFGIVWMRRGEEVATGGRVQQQLMTVGTVARIVDADQLPNGLLGITVQGHERFELASTRVGPDGLVIGQVRLQAPLAAAPRAGRWDELQAFFERLTRHPEIRRLGLAIDGEDAWQLGFALAQLLPFSQADKYTLLLAEQAEDLMEKLELMLDAIQRTGELD
jgi:uncharacterized protein